MATTAGTTEALVKSTCGLAELATAAITPHLPSAEIKARAYIGDTVYAALVAATDPYASTDKDQLKRAEAFFAAGITLGLSNLHTQGSGVFGAVAGLNGEQVAMIGDSRLTAQIARYEALAYEALAPYWIDNREAIRAASDSTDGLPDPQSIRAGRVVMRASR